MVGEGHNEGVDPAVKQSAVKRDIDRTAWSTHLSRAADLGSILTFTADLFSGRVIPVTQQFAVQWPPSVT